MFAVEREVAMEIGAGRLNLVDFIFVETNSIEPSNAQEETQCHDEQKQSGLIARWPFRGNVLLIAGRACDIWDHVWHCYRLLNHACRSRRHDRIVKNVESISVHDIDHETTDTLVIAHKLAELSGKAVSSKQWL